MRSIKIVALLFLSSASFAATITSRINMNIPAFGDQNWDGPLRDDFNLLDSTSAFLAQPNTFTGLNTFSSQFTANAGLKFGDGTIQTTGFSVVTDTVTSFNATVSSITNITTQNFTAVQSTSTNLTATNIVASTLTLSGNIVGNLSGVTVPTGYVGEVVTVYNAVSGGGVPTVGNVGIATATLTTGYWYVSATYCSDNNATQTGFNALLMVKGSLANNQQGNDNQQVRLSAGTSVCAPFGARSVLVAAADTNKTISVWATSITAVGSGFSTISAIRYK